MTDKYEKLGEVIKCLRKFRKLTQSKLSEITGFSQNTISNHENGNRKVKLNDISKYAKALGLSEYLILKINDELNENDTSKTLNNLQEFLRIYDFASRAYYQESDIYFYSYDIFDEALQMLNLLNEAKVNVNNVSYEYIVDLYKQILSNNITNSKTPYKEIVERENTSSYSKVTLEELTDFSLKYIDLISNILHAKSNTDKNKLIEEATQLKKNSLELSEKLKYVPNYSYDAIKGEPMYKVYSEKYPKRLDEFIEMIRN